ncbi:transposase family protein [Streptomyces sp. NBC_01445]|uniref:transposase family protein n=1 Tax=Streptomyces sp. NBC_01445 TaxID=2903869 RepID=UPI002DD9902A|nr:transposase family protein [Streptomyces sp. NBC_01445]WSE08932.1 transposase family protein [Streptomyces sp. NBC_01445]
MTQLILDGTLIESDRVSGERENGNDLRFSQKHKAFGGKVQFLSAPDGTPLWVCEVEPGSTPDITAARIYVLPALYQAAAQGLLDDRIHGRAGNPAVLAALEQLVSAQAQAQAQARVRVAGPDAMWQQAQQAHQVTQAFHGVRRQLHGPRGWMPVPGQVWIGMVQSVTGPQDQFVVAAAKVLDDPEQ